MARKEMNEAANVLREIGNLPLSDEAYAALQMGEETLRGSAWIRTSKKAPAAEDADTAGYVAALFELHGRLRSTVCPWEQVSDSPERYLYWNSLPPLPEED